MAQYDDENRATRNAKKFAGDTLKEFKAKPMLLVFIVAFIFIVLSILF